MPPDPPPRRAVQALPDVVLTEPQLTEPADVAAGPRSVASALRRTTQEMGLWRSLKVLNGLNQKGGFDCPGCAWPDPVDRSALAEYCENGAKAVAEEATRARVTPDFFAQHAVEALSRKDEYWLGKQGRLTQPVVLRAGSNHYEPIGWDDAFALIAEELNGLASPDEAVFYTSGRTSNEAAFLWQLFARRFGTNNLPDCSNMCHESSGVGLGEVIGVGKGTVTLEDFAQAEVIFVVGQNPGTNHPRMLATLQEAKRAGAQIVHVNPLPETGLQRFKHPQEVRGWVGKGTALADLFLPVRINGDVALFKGLMKRLIERADAGEPVLDQSFIDAKTEGFAAFADDLRATPWEAVLEGSGVDRARIEEAADLVARHDRVIVCWAMGLTQHANGVANVQTLVDLLLLRGALGRPGAGACPVRGHSNVQGDRTVGIHHAPPEAFLDRLAERFSFEPPRTPGLDTVDAIRAMRDGQAHVFISMGGNFLSATPDTVLTAEALQRCRLTVQISTKLNRAHAVTGRQALILPCLGRTEVDEQASGAQFVTVENSMGIVHRSQGRLAPASEHLRSEPAIVAGIAQATLGPDDGVEWDALVADYDRIRDAIEAVVPGFENYNRRVREPDGFYLPNPVRDAQRFDTPSGRARFTIHPIPAHRLAAGRYLMMTIRSHDQYNTTIYGLDDRYRGIKGERRVVLLHPEDLAAEGLTAGDVVDLVSHFQGEERTAEQFAVVPFDLPRRCAATYFPEANVLVPVDHVAAKSNTPASKSVVISLRRRDG